MKAQKGRRHAVEQILLPHDLYSHGPTLLHEALRNINILMEGYYKSACADYPGPVFESTLREYVRDNDSVLIIRIGMPAPETAMLSRSVYLCFSDKDQDNLYLTSELAKDGRYYLCCRPYSKIIRHMICADAPENAADEFDMIAGLYWELVIQDGIKQFESLCAG